MANADIRQLEMDGSVFYPQTDINGLVNNGEYAFDDEPKSASKNLVNSDVIYNLRNTFPTISNNIIKFHLGHIKPDGTDGDYNITKRISSCYFKIYKHELILSDYANIYIFEYDDDLNFVSVNSNAKSSYTASSDKIIRILLIEQNGVLAFDLLDHFSLKRMSEMTDTNFCNIDKNFRSVVAGFTIKPTDLTWIHGHINDQGNIGTYDITHRLISDICFFRKGTILSTKQEDNVSLYAIGYNNDFSFYRSMGATGRMYTFTEDVYAKIVLIDQGSPSKSESELISCLTITSLENELSYRPIERTSNGYTRLNFEHGNIDSNGQVDHTYKNEFMSNFHFFRKGGIINIQGVANLHPLFTMYIAEYDCENGPFVQNIDQLGAVYTLPRDIYGRLCVLDTKTPEASYSWKWLSEYIIYVERTPKSSIDLTSLKSSFVKNYTGNVSLSFSQGGYNDTTSETSSYKYYYRIHSDVICAKKGDRILHRRYTDEVLNIITINENYNFVKYDTMRTYGGGSTSSYFECQYDVHEDSFIILESFHTSDANWDGNQQLIDCISYDRLGVKDGFDISNFEHGSLYMSGGVGQTDNYARSKNIFHVKRGTQIVPYVFGRYCISFYDDNMNFIKRLPEDIIDPSTGEKIADGGQRNSGWFEQNAYEFKEDANIRVMLYWMPAAGFYNQPKYANIIPNDDVLEHIVCKFRLIEPNYPVPEYVKQEIVNNAKILDTQYNGLFKFTFITDIHEYAYHNAAAVYCANLTSRALLQGGDMLSWPQYGIDEGFEMIQRHIPYLLESKVPVLITKGNHEMTMSGTDPLGNTHTNLYTKQLWYEQVQLPLRRKEYKYHDDVIDYQGISFKDPLGGYFYYDDELYKVRIICMDTFVGSGAHVMTTNQRIWLAYDALDLSSKGADEENWCVFAFSHSQILDGDIYETHATREERWCCDAFEACYNKELTVLSNPDFDPGYREWTSLTPDFSNVKYQFVAYICGHVHYDSVASKNYQSEADTKGLIPRDFLHISTTCSHPLENDDALRRDFNTITEYVIDVFCLDRENRTLHIKRIGTGQDRDLIY